MKKRYCPCGTPLEQKPGERDAAFAKREYCNGEHRNRYYQRKPATNGFGFIVPRNKRLRVGQGMEAFVEGKRLPGAGSYITADSHKQNV